MIPLAIILAVLVLADAGLILHWWSEKEKEKQAAQAVSSGELLAQALKDGKISALSAPGLEGEMSGLTSHLAQFENVAAPSVDLDYSKRLTGQAPAQQLFTMAELEAAKACFGVEEGDANWGECSRFDFDNDKVIDIRDMSYMSMRLGSSATKTAEPEAEALLALARGQTPLAESSPPQSSMPPEAAASTLAGQGKAGMLALALAHTPGIVAEAASLGQLESVMWTVMDLIAASGLPDIVKASQILPYEVAVLGPAKYHYNNVYRPMQPSAQDLPRMLARGMINPEDYLRQMSYQGYDGHWAVAYWNQFLRLPEWRDLQSMLWRGLIDDTGFKQTMFQLGWHPDVVDEMLNLAWLIPGPNDLIRFVVREVISPSDFIKWMNQQGFGPGWAGAYWTAHFQLPSPDFLIDAFHRGRISDAELQKYIFWHDYMPERRPGIAVSDIEIMRSLTKRLIPRVDVRRGWELGKLSDADLEERYRWLGYEDDAPLMADIQKAVAMEAENSAIARSAADLYREGFLSPAEYEGWLRVANFSDARIAKTRASEDLRYRLDYIRDLVDVAVEGYRKDVFTLDELRAELIQLGMTPERAEALIQKEAFRKLPKPKAA